MSETERIQDQLERAHAGNAWHGPPLRNLLSDISAATASTSPKVGSHSIWQIALHILAWQRVVLRRMAGETIGDLPPEQDWPVASDTSDAAWKQVLAQLDGIHKQLCEAIAKFPETRLSEKVPGHRYPFYGMLHGVIQHNLYHAGQIAILKKG
jgi:uncharacterized damage-inducible protein DinB